MYDNIVMRDLQNNAAFNRWSTGEEGIQISDAQEWNEVCHRAFRSTRETKLQSLQYKIINRIVPCGTHLKQLRIRETDECPKCKMKDSIIHFFFHCNVVCDLWRKICGWFLDNVNLHLERITPKEFLLGVPSDYHMSKIINFTLIQIRFFIFRQKLFHNSELCLFQWLREYRDKLRTEKWISSRTGKKTSHLQCDTILRALG